MTVDWNSSGELRRLISELSAVAAPAGNEDRLSRGVAEQLRSRGLDPVIDRLGQVAVTLEPLSGDADAHSLMLSAHLDELGLTVRRIDAGGWLRVHRLGGMPERVLPGTRLRVHTRAGDLPAVVGLKSHHLTPPEEKYGARPATELYLDVGASGGAEAERMGVRVGDPVTYAPTWEELVGGRVSGKALDDRTGVAALLSCVDRLLQEPPSCRVHVAFTCQEEFNVRGSLALVRRFAPDVVINVDVAPATDTPDLAGAGSVALGAGPALSRLSFHGRGTLGGLVPHPALVRAVESAAATETLALQYDATVGVITDAAFVPMATAEGVAAVGVGIPVRYTHAPIETAQLSDVRDCATLLTRLTYDAAALDLSRGATQIEGGGIA